ncbi:hypothetical protein [Cryptosporangium arvum]|uniref:Uncharacterized protein n=1 Tax=Cryptosporangium arvum DSM 44712 TaxID=927661 RepID=A0A010Z537_9ACTN|nr:hypothetical protein [Cryptosporangium arvum]EXG82463.1 hypothetical protein CryarDRAFT_3651 [Cryptosporangium arvum DSM 44712]
MSDPVLLPVERPGRCGPRTIGAYVSDGASVRYQPAVDVERLVLGVVAVAGAAAVLGSALHRTPAVGPVSMGPGGWLSVRGARAPRARATDPGSRPWWAHALRARRLR